MKQIMNIYSDIICQSLCSVTASNYPLNSFTEHLISHFGNSYCISVNLCARAVQDLFIALAFKSCRPTDNSHHLCPFPVAPGPSCPAGHLSSSPGFCCIPTFPNSRIFLALYYSAPHVRSDSVVFIAAGCPLQTFTFSFLQMLGYSNTFPVTMC